MILQLEINKTNTKLISTNKTSCYILGIGMTDYTIHREANDIKEMYYDRTGFFKNFGIKDFHNYHVYQARIKSIAGEIKYKEIITYKGKKYNVIDAYIGLPDKCRLIYNPYRHRSIDYLTFEGEDMKNITEHLKYVLILTELYDTEPNS